MAESTGQASLFDGGDDPRTLRERPTAPARVTDPATSKAAALMPFKRNTQRHRLLIEYALHTEGLIDEEAARKAQIYAGCPWKRCSELREMLLIAPTGKTRLSTMLAAQQVCQITGKGREVLAALATPN